MSARKIGFLILVLLFGAVVELSWNLRENHYSIGPEGVRVLGGRFYGPSFEFEETAERALPSDEATEVEVRNAFGAVRVIPGEGSGIEVRLRKVVFQSTEEKARAFAERVELQIEEDEGGFRVGTNRDDLEGDDDVGFETHLEVRVPPGTAARVRNEHGVVDVRGVASARVRSAFDDVRVEAIAGAVSIDARQGAVEATGLGADLTLESRHGDVEVSDVAGQADLDVQHGRVSLREVGGVKARASYGEFEARNVAGDVVVHARHTGVTATDVRGGTEIQTTFADVRVEGVAGPVQVRVEHGDAHLAPGLPVTQTIEATATHGEIHLDVPEGSRFELDAESRHGAIDLDVPGLDAEVTAPGTPARATGTMGSGGPRVTLRARGDITLEGRPAALPAEQE